MTVFTCFGICASYMVFMAATLADVVSMSQIRLVAYLTPVMMSLSWLRDLSYVSVTSALGNVSVYSGMAFVAFVALQRMGAAATSPLAAFPAGIAGGVEEAGSGEGGGLGKLAVSMNVAKAIMGAGGFAIPWAFAKGGLALTPAIMASAMAVSLFTLQAMLQAKNEAVTRGWGG